MKTKSIQDERVIVQTRKIGNEGFHILLFGLFCIMIYQQYILNAPFAEFAGETLLFFVGSMYYVGRNLLVGNNLFYSSKKASHKYIIISSLLTGVVVSTINTTRNYLAGYIHSASKETLLISLITCLSAAIITFILLEVLYAMNKKKQEKIESAFDEEE